MELRWNFDGSSMVLRRISGVFRSLPPISAARPLLHSACCWRDVSVMFRWNFDGTSMVLRWFFEGFRGFFALFLQSLLPAHSRTPHTAALHYRDNAAPEKVTALLRRKSPAQPSKGLQFNPLPTRAQTSRMNPEGATRELGLWPQCLFWPAGIGRS